MVKKKTKTAGKAKPTSLKTEVKEPNEQKLNVPYSMWKRIDGIINCGTKNHKIKWNGTEKAEITYIDGENLTIHMPLTPNDDYVLTGTASNILHYLKRAIEKEAEPKIPDNIQTIRIPFVLAESIMGVIEAGKYHEVIISKDKRHVKINYKTGETLDIFHPKRDGDEFIMSGTETTVISVLNNQIRDLDERTPTHTNTSSPKKEINTDYKDRMLTVSPNFNDTLLHLIEWGEVKNATKWVDSMTAWINLPAADILILFPRVDCEAPALVLTNAYGENIVKQYGCEYEKTILPV